MGRLLISLITGILVSISLSNCDSNARTYTLLDKAEILMAESPDSSLVILESISPQSLKNDADRALYGLLYTQALDKNFLCPDNDSVISAASEYFAYSGDYKRLAEATYYMGMVRFNAGDLRTALISFFKAKELAENHDMYFLAGMACRGISDIYQTSYNSAEELAYAEKEYELIRKSGRQPYLNYALHDLGRALYNNGNLEQSVDIVGQIVDSAAKYDDPYLYSCARNLLAHNLMYREDYDGAYPVLSEICSSAFAEAEDSVNLCLAMIRTGRITEASTIMNYMDNIPEPKGSTLRYEIFKHSGDYPSALAEIESIDSLTDVKLRETMSHDLTSSLVDYYGQEKRINKAKLKTSRILLGSAVIVLILSLMLVCAIGLSIYYRQKKNISEKNRLASQLRVELDNLQKKSSEPMLRILFESKYALIDEFCSIMRQNNNSGIASRKIADTVSTLIEKLSVSSENLKSLEDEIDRTHLNLMSDFRRELPNLKEADYRLFIFSIAGLSAASISVLLKEEKIEAVYNRKRRLKNKIRSLTSDSQERFLDYL